MNSEILKAGIKKSIFTIKNGEVKSLHPDYNIYEELLKDCRVNKNGELTIT